MVKALAILLSIQLFGEVIVRLFNLPIPGPVIGMLLLFGLLLVRGSVPATLEKTARGLIQHLSLMFIPAGAGVMTYVTSLRYELLPLALTLVLSLLITMGVTAWTMTLLSKVQNKKTYGT